MQLSDPAYLPKVSFSFKALITMSILNNFEHCSARIDGLVKQDETPTEMTQTFTGRDDYLYYRHVTFATRTKKFGPTQPVNYRPIVVRMTY